MSQHPVIIMSGPSGVGKGTILGEVLQRDNRLTVAISATTRPPRPHEVHGVNYYFLSNDEFDAKVDADAFVEWCHVHGNRYGTLEEEVFERPRSGPLFLEIDIQGAEKIKAKHPEVTLIFIAPPNLGTLHDRLKKRNTEEDDVIASRLTIAEKELERMSNYDYVVINEDLERAVQDVQEILDKVADAVIA